MATGRRPAGAEPRVFGVLGGRAGGGLAGVGGEVAQQGIGAELAVCLPGVRQLDAHGRAESREGRRKRIRESARCHSLRGHAGGGVKAPAEAGDRGRAGGHSVHEESGRAGEDLIRPGRIGDDRAAGAGHHRDGQTAPRHRPRRRPALRWGGAWRPRVGRPHRHERPRRRWPPPRRRRTALPRAGCGRGGPALQGAGKRAHLDEVCGISRACFCWRADPLVDHLPDLLVQLVLLRDAVRGPQQHRRDRHQPDHPADRRIDPFVAA